MEPIETTVFLSSIKDDYRASMPRTSERIAQSLIEHCLWYFIREGGAPDIRLIDGDNRISLNDDYDSYMHNAASIECFELKKQLFEISHIKLKINASEKNSIFYSASNRLVKTENLKGKIPGLFGSLQDDNGEF